MLTSLWLARNSVLKLTTHTVKVTASTLSRVVRQSVRDAGLELLLTSPELLQFIPRPMTIEEASRILEVDSSALRAENVESRYQTLFDLNNPNKSEGFAGSPYLQRRVTVARQILLDAASAAASQSR